MSSQIASLYLRCIDCGLLATQNGGVVSGIPLTIRFMFDIAYGLLQKPDVTNQIRTLCRLHLLSWSTITSEV